jgi:hypothetical protein
MFNGPTVDRIDRGRAAFETTGVRLEQELLGGVNEKKYKELAYAFLHRNEKPENGSDDEKFEWILKVREASHTELGSFSDIIKQENYINYKNSMNLVEQCQVGDPEKPSKFFTGALHQRVQDYFGDKYTLKYFSSIGNTQLDILHGIDCFFKLYKKNNDDKLEEAAVATIDLAELDKGAVKADILLKINEGDAEKYDPSLGNKAFNKENFDSRVGDVAELVIRALTDNLKERELNKQLNKLSKN